MDTKQTKLTVGQRSNTVEALQKQLTEERKLRRRAEKHAKNLEKAIEVAREEVLGTDDMQADQLVVLSTADGLYRGLATFERTGKLRRGSLDGKYALALFRRDGASLLEGPRRHRGSYTARTITVVGELKCNSGSPTDLDDYFAGIKMVREIAEEIFRTIMFTEVCIASDYDGTAVCVDEERDEAWEEGTDLMKMSIQDLNALFEKHN